MRDAGGSCEVRRSMKPSMLQVQSSRLNENPVLPIRMGNVANCLATLLARIPRDTFQQSGHCRLHPPVMAFRVQCREAGRHGAHEMVAPWTCTLHQELASTLEILHHGMARHNTASSANLSRVQAR